LATGLFAHCCLYNQLAYTKQLRLADSSHHVARYSVGGDVRAYRGAAGRGPRGACHGDTTGKSATACCAESGRSA